MASRSRWASTRGARRRPASRPGAVSQSLATLIGGSGGGSELSLGGEPVSVGVPAGRVESVKEVKSLPVGATGASLEDVAKVQMSQAPSAVSRTGGEPAVTVTGDISGKDTNAISAAVGNRVDGLNLADGVKASVRWRVRRHSPELQ